MNQLQTLSDALCDLLKQIESTDLELIVGGGFGIYLKTEHVRKLGSRTLIDPEFWPEARSTNDIDLFLRPELLADSAKLERLLKYWDGPRRSKLGRMARRERGACPQRPVTSEQRSQTLQIAPARRVAPLFCLSGVAPQSQTHEGYASSSRLAQAKKSAATRAIPVFQQSL